MSIDAKTFFWFAGLCEGEGYFGLREENGQSYPLLSLTMTDEDVIAKVAALFDHGYTTFNPKQEHWNITYKFTLRGWPAVKVMKQIYPLMGLRRKAQIDRILKDYVYDPYSSISRSKISHEQVREIKKRLAAGETAKSIAQDFPISHYAIWDIRSGKTWGHVEANEEINPSVEPPYELIDLPNTVENQFMWLVGLLEGEGSFMAGPPSNPNIPRISLAMTDKDVVARAAELCQSRYAALQPRNEKHKNVYRLYIKGAKAVALMNDLQPYLSQRRQAQIARVLNSYVEFVPRKGADNHSAKLSEAEAREIKLRLAKGERIPYLADEFGVSLSIIREIKYGRTWKHIQIDMP